MHGSSHHGPETGARSIGGIACPGCSQAMSAWALDPGLNDAAAAGYRGSELRIQQCSGCSSTWVDRKTLAQIIQSAALRGKGSNDIRAVSRRIMSMPAQIVYRACPGCGERMGRRNFGRYSGIVIDECSDCGSFFAPRDLDAVVAFVRTGGLNLSPQPHVRPRVEGYQRIGGTLSDIEHEAELAVLPHYPRAGLGFVLEFLRWFGAKLWRLWKLRGRTSRRSR